MKSNIQILNVFKYEKEGSIRSCLSFHFVDDENKTTTNNFKGYADLKIYYNSSVAYDNIPLDIIGKIVEAEIVEKSSSYNPLRKTTSISSITYKGTKYNLF